MSKFISTRISRCTGADLAARTISGQTCHPYFHDDVRAAFTSVYKEIAYLRHIVSGIYHRSRFEDGGRNKSPEQMLDLLLSTLIAKVKACT